MCRSRFGQQVLTSNVLATDTEGFQKGSCLTPLAGNPKTKRFLARLSSISSRQEMDRGCGPRRPALGLSAKSNFRWCGHENETSFILRAFAKRGPQGLSCKGPHSDFLQNLTLGGAGMRMKQVSFSELLQKEVRGDCPAKIEFCFIKKAPFCKDAFLMERLLIA